MNIPTDIIISTAGVVLSAIIAARISRHTTLDTIAAEKEKQLKIWEHEKEVERAAGFSGMFTAVTEYMRVQSGSAQRNAIEKIDAVRVKESGDICGQLDKLYAVVSQPRTYEAMNKNEIQGILDAILAEYRKSGDN